MGSSLKRWLGAKVKIRLLQIVFFGALFLFVLFCLQDLLFYYAWQHTWSVEKLVIVLVIVVVLMSLLALGYYGKLVLDMRRESRRLLQSLRYINQIVAILVKVTK